ncbi:unnamed protein product [Lactuca virosa]|uniref:Uncharacterized protein n=1 Tax=Lactuca virosa TaxID=75947 RepID=A0AAU9NCU6_9ASTR|nr:unnamed protein product [Lactuca virosa]
MIINAKYPKLKGRGENLDLKSLGPSTFGLMKQNRKTSKYVFQGTKPLVKFGCFAKIGEDSDSDEVIVSEQEDDNTPPVAIVVEEHVPMINVNDDDEDDDEIVLGDNALGFDNNRDDDGAEMGQEGELSGFDDDDVYIDYGPNDDELGSFFDNVNEVGISPTETQGETNILKLPQQTPDQMDNFFC